MRDHYQPTLTGSASQTQSGFLNGPRTGTGHPPIKLGLQIPLPASSKG